MNPYAGFVFLTVFLAVPLFATRCVRQRCPYYRSYSPNHLFGESFIEAIYRSEDEPILNTVSATYLVSAQDATYSCYERETIPYTPDLLWCHRPPCYSLHLRECTNSNSICYLTDPNRGQCVERQEVKIVFPGEVCDKQSKCPFGGQKCEWPGKSTVKRCNHLKPSEKCRTSSDCEPGYYCASYHGVHNECIKVQLPNQDCTHDEMCGGNALCHFDKLNDPSGRCVEFLSLKNGEYIGIEITVLGNRLKSVAATENLLCQTGYVNATGYCDTPTRKAANKGVLCNSHLDCKTEDDKAGYCVQSILDATVKHCAPLEADKEWQDAFEAFKEYYEKVKPKLRADKWYPHEEENLYNKMVCKVYKAFYYGVYYDCIKADQAKLKSIPVVRKIIETCQSIH